MKALELLKIIYKDCKKWEDKGFAVTYPTSDLSEAIKELEDVQKLIDSFDKKMPKGDKVFKIEIVDDLNQVVMEKFK